MPKYLFKTNLTRDGLAGTLAEGGTSRRETISKLAENVGGRIESFYYAFGGTDAYVIVDLPDNETAAAVAVTVSASGAASVETVVLIEPEQVDAASQMTIDYRKPGD